MPSGRVSLSCEALSSLLLSSASLATSTSLSFQPRQLDLGRLAGFVQAPASCTVTSLEHTGAPQGSLVVSLLSGITLLCYLLSVSEKHIFLFVAVV